MICAARFDGECFLRPNQITAQRSRAVRTT
jgi:hypothetical protein